MEFEWHSADAELHVRAGDAVPALLDLIRSVILDSSSGGVPAIVAVERASRRLAQHIADLRIL